MLGQFVLVRLPDPVTLGRDPDSETGLAGMQTLLLLVLGCAVQGPSKESVIEDIKRLPLATQHDIVNCIQQVNRDLASNYFPGQNSYFGINPKNSQATSTTQNCPIRIVWFGVARLLCFRLCIDYPAVQSQSIDVYSA